jgi:hypothetical protein
MIPDHFRQFDNCCAECRLSRWEPDRYKFRCIKYDFTMGDSEAERSTCDDYEEWDYD